MFFIKNNKEYILQLIYKVQYYKIYVLIRSLKIDSNNYIL